MNRKLREAKKCLKNSPVLFDDEEIFTSSSDEVRASKSTTSLSKIQYSGHSTPIRIKSNKTDSSDSPELIYNESPIEPLTQNPPNEVGWDYQRVTKDELIKTPISMDISKTPKRSLLPKKRNSNSPLLYKPLKKKLIHDEQKETIVDFMAELQAIQLKAKQIGEKNVEDSHKTDHRENHEPDVEMDSQPSDDSDIKLQVSVNTDESPGQNKIIDKVSANQLIDDSIEDMLVLCSQQVEAQEFGIKNEKQNKSANSSAGKNEQSLSNNEVVSESSSKNSFASKGESTSLEIPDDSFDEIFFGIDEKDLCKHSNESHSKSTTKSTSSTTTSKSSTVQNKFFQSKNSTCTAPKKVPTSTTSSNYVKYSQSTYAQLQNKVVNTKANFGYLNKDYVKNNSSSGYSTQTQMSYNGNNDKNTETRLFKAKSFSDSNFLEQSNSNKFGNNYFRSNSNLHINSVQPKSQNENVNNQNSEANSTSPVEKKIYRRVHSSSSIDRSNASKNSQSSVNKLSNSTEGLQSTPEEIERKRQEALMKREAKLRMKSNDTSLKKPFQQPVKR